MNTLFDNMAPYQEILIIMGMVIFLALIFLLIWSVMKKRSITVLLPFFLIPIIMVAFPTLKSVKIAGMSIEIQEIQKLSAVVSTNPSDTAAANRLEESIDRLKTNDNFPKNSEALVAVAKGQIALGKYDSASVYINKAEKVAPGSKEITITKNILDQKLKLRENFTLKVRSLNHQIEHLKQSPGDTQTVHQIAKTLSEVKAPAYVNPNEAVTLAKSYAITGDRQQSLKIINKLNTALTVKDSNIDNLTDSIRNSTYRKQFIKQHAAVKINDPSVIQHTDILKQSAIHKIQ